MAQEKPNILIIQTDQLAAQALSCYGHAVTKTPYIDSLAKEGVVFENTYCNNPLCAPSRASMLTGQYTSNIGAYDNAAEFSADIPTLAHYMRSNGYRTILCGKMHFVGADQLHGFEERLTTDIYPADYGWTPNWKNPVRRYDWWYHNMDSVYEAGAWERTNQLDYDDEVSFQAERQIYHLARDRDRRPFCMAISFTHPHDPYACPKEYWDRYDHDAIDLPRVGHIPYEECDPHAKRLRHVYKMDQEEIGTDFIRKARHAYYGQISYIDDKIGCILSVLAECGLREKTIIIFTSDHGDMLGERGLWYKMSFHEWSVRVPLIIANNNYCKPGRVKTPVSLLDVLPTVLDLTGCKHAKKAADALNGESLKPFLQRAEKNHAITEHDILDFERPVISEYLAEGAVAPMVMVRKGRYKYIYCPVDPPLLYDLENDPDELQNLAVKIEYQGLMREMRDIITAHQNMDRLHEMIIASQKRRRLVFKAHMTGQHFSWDYQPLYDASKCYMRNHLNLNDLERKTRLLAKKDN